MIKYSLILAILLNLITGTIHSQAPVTLQQTQEKKLVVLIKNDKTEYVGYIISEDEREVLLETETLGRMFIPKHEIHEIREVGEKEMRDGVYIGTNIFSSRYFLTTNGLSMKKGDNYAMLNLYGPEAHFSVADNLTIGGITTWIGAPIILSTKYSINVNENLHFGLGVLLGTMSYIDFGSVGAVGYGSITFGNNRTNLTFSGGYAGVTNGSDSGSAPLFSVAGMARLGKHVSFVGDSFIYAGDTSFTLIIPGLRFSRKESNAFQFGFGGLFVEGDVYPIPIVSWFLSI